MLDLLKNLFTSRRLPQEAVDIPGIINQIKEIESVKSIPLGRRIHSFSYRGFQLHLDRDITEHYRVTVYRGRERIYSFTVFAKLGNYNILEKAYTRIVTFLDEGQQIRNLPDDDTIKGFFYGYE